MVNFQFQADTGVPCQLWGITLLKNTMVSKSVEPRPCQKLMAKRLEICHKKFWKETTFDTTDLLLLSREHVYQAVA
jgi:hypothetical protein